MKMLFASIILFSVNSFAQVSYKPCDFEDYQNLQESLELEIRDGAELKSEIDSLLIQEMGPRCTLTTDANMNVRIYNLISGDRSYGVFVFDSEKPSYVSLSLSVQE